jgi:hypothetical protein
VVCPLRAVWCSRVGKRSERLQCCIFRRDLLQKDGKSFHYTGITLTLSNVARLQSCSSIIAPIGQRNLPMSQRDLESR